MNTRWSSCMPSLLIVSEVRLFRDGLAELLTHGGAVDVVGTIAGSDDTVRAADELHPDVIVLDHAVPHSLALARTLADARPQSHVVTLGGTESDDDMLAFAEAGVAGYVSRDATVQELVVAIEGVARGELVCSARQAGTIARRLAWRASMAADATDGVLTARELEVVRLVARGYSNKEIATALGIELATAKNHVHHLLEKLHLRRRSEIAARVGGSLGPR
jgi:DNA-binding NarL/FixJ family response regulator